MLQFGNRMAEEADVDFFANSLEILKTRLLDRFLS
jgi:hypothetical protein